MKRFTQLEYETILEKSTNGRIVCLGRYKSTVLKILHACVNCGYCWKVVPSSFIHRNMACPSCECNGSSSTKTQEGICVDRLFTANPDLLFLRRVNYGAEYLCTICGYIWTATQFVPERTKCKHCGAVKRAENTNKWQRHPIKLKGTWYNLQGYEDYAIIYLSSIGFDVNSLSLTVDEGKPIIIYEEDNRVRQYLPDFYHSDTNTVFEVKSTWTFAGNDQYFNNIKNKRDACLKNGFKFELLCMNTDGTKIPIPKFWRMYDLKSMQKFLKQVHNDKDYWNKT